jgi:hypothetical protein
MPAFYTDHFVNQTVTQFFSKSLRLPLLNINEYKDNEEIFITYGILRGTGEIIKKKNKNFIYIDHGFYKSSSRKFTKEKKTILNDLGGYFRVIKGDLYFNETDINLDSKRFDELDIELKNKRKGNIIILSEPSQNTLDFLGIKNWTEDTINEIKKYSDRKIVVHNKFSDVPLKLLLQDAFAFVSCQSTAGFLSITEGVPAYFTHQSLKKYGEIADIEKNLLNHDVLYVAANSQWKLKEFFSDEFKLYIDKIINN